MILLSLARWGVAKLQGELMYSVESLSVWPQSMTNCKRQPPANGRQNGLYKFAVCQCSRLPQIWPSWPQIWWLFTPEVLKWSGEDRVLGYQRMCSLKKAPADTLEEALPTPILKVKVWVTSSCLTLCDPMDCSPPGSSVHGILQARILEWVVISSSRGSSQPRNWTWVSYVSCIGRWVL